MAGGAAGAPMGQTTDQGFPAQQPSQASQYSNYGAQPNGAFYAGPMAGAPAYTPQAQQAPVQQPQGGFPSPLYGQQMNQPQYGGGYGQGYGSPFGGMGGFPGQGYGFGGMGNQFMGGGYGYQPQPQYGFGGMGNQFMGGAAYDPRPAMFREPMRGGFGGMPDRPSGMPVQRNAIPRQLTPEQQALTQALSGPMAGVMTQDQIGAANKLFGDDVGTRFAERRPMPQGPAFGGFQGPRRGFGGYGGGYGMGGMAMQQPWDLERWGNSLSKGTLPPGAID